MVGWFYNSDKSGEATAANKVVFATNQRKEIIPGGAAVGVDTEVGDRPQTDALVAAGRAAAAETEVGGGTGSAVAHQRARTR